MMINLAALTIVRNTNLPHMNAGTANLRNILTLVFVTIGSLSLLMMVIAGFRYVLSAGNEEKMATAKRMIIYTVVGVVVSAAAAIIVNAVMGYVGQ